MRIHYVLHISPFFNPVSYRTQYNCLALKCNYQPATNFFSIILQYFKYINYSVPLSTLVKEAYRKKGISQQQIFT